MCNYMEGCVVPLELHLVAFGHDSLLGGYVQFLFDVGLQHLELHLVAFAPSLWETLHAGSAL
jgi:hypothetical protein